MEVDVYRDREGRLQLARTGRPGEEALGWFLVVAFGRGDVIEALRRGESLVVLGQEGPVAHAVSDYEAQGLTSEEQADLAWAAIRWLEWSGQEPGADSYLLSVPWRSHDLLVPRAFLLEFLIKVRHEGVRSREQPSSLAGRTEDGNTGIT